jgi:hypothetical protein
MSTQATALVREFDAPQKGCPMRFVRIGLAFYAAALLSGCQSLRKQPPATFEPVRIPPVRDGEYAPERPRPRSSVATEPDEAPLRRPVKSIAWPRFGTRGERPEAEPRNAPQSTSARTEIPARTVSNPLTDRMRRLFKASAAAECTDNCDGSPQYQFDSPGAIAEPSLTPRGPASVRAHYGSPTPAPRTAPIPDTTPAPSPTPAPGRSRVPGPAIERRPQVIVEDEPARPSLPPVLVEDPPMSIPPVPAAPARPEVPLTVPDAPAVPDTPVFPEPPTFPPLVPPEVPATRDPVPAPGKASTKSKSKSTTPRKTTSPLSSDDDAVLEERLRQSAERMRSNGRKSAGTVTPSEQQDPADAGDTTTDPPLWPKRFGGSPPVGEPVLDPLPESAAPPKPGTSNPMPAPAAPLDSPANVPPTIPGLPPTIDLDDEIPRPPRTPPASPSPTSFRSRTGRSL